MIEASLITAIKQGNLDKVKYLVEKGVNIDVRGSFNMTPLILAIIHNRLEIAKYLIDNGAEVNLIDNSGGNALFYAIYDCNI